MAEEETRPEGEAVPSGTAPATAEAKPAPTAATAPAAPVGSPPMTPVTPDGPAPAALPQGRSNTIGPGVRASLEKKGASEEEGGGLTRRGFMKWSLPVGWVAFSAATASSLVASARFMFPN